MSTVDMSLDDIIARNSRSASGSTTRRAGGGASSSRGGRPAPSRNTRPAARQTRQSTAPYSRGRGGGASARGSAGGARNNLNNASVSDVAASRNPLLKVSAESVPNKVAGAICNVVREARGGEPPSVMATGPAAINQAIKAIAIARKYLLAEDKPVEITVEPRFEQDLREGSNVVLVLKKARSVYEREPMDDDLSVKDGTDAFKLAGAIAQRAREGNEVNVTTKGSIPILIAVKAIALAQDYLSEDNMELKFVVQFRDLDDDTSGRNLGLSTFLHMALIVREA